MSTKKRKPKRMSYGRLMKSLRRAMALVVLTTAGGCTTMEWCAVREDTNFDDRPFFAECTTDSDCDLWETKNGYR